MKIILAFFLLAYCGFSCGIEKDVPAEVNPEMYFPPKDASQWETLEPKSLNWDESKISNLENFLETNGTRAFVILKDGKIILEKYWGNNILNTGAFDTSSRWYWASAAKAITSFLVGIAQEENQLDIKRPSADYLGQGWTSLSREKESLITVEHHLTMSTGLEYDVSDLNCTSPSCLTYKADAGTQWYYHNAPYLLLKDVVSNATKTNFNTYTQNKLTSKIGMTGSWVGNELDALFWSNARDMARFGLLILNKGQWENQVIMQDQVYFDDMVTKSQDLNPSYGYLWWLNGMESVIFPTLPNTLNTSLSPNAPAEMIAAMGKNGQFINVVPSENLVIVRMGEAPSNLLVPVTFHDEMWEKINQILDK